MLIPNHPELLEEMREAENHKDSNCSCPEVRPGRMARAWKGGQRKESESRYNFESVLQACEGERHFNGDVWVSDTETHFER